ncbi:hypothetical protein [Sphingopyxis granuli]|uniref:hypothetical protein n=1 Tax=Sphingopyxis granuli TaxID=267128 RepID=UPI001BB0387E|nr:hypothetical protein [Sphingopyxis granuli]QUM73334.1 hypothetical protein ICN83_05460 [Sphingopyxis granuli]
MSSAGEAGVFSGDGDGGRAAIDAARREFDQARDVSAQLPLIADGDLPAVPDLAESDAYVSLPDAAEILQLQMSNGGDLHKAVQEHRRLKGEGGRKPGSKNRQNRAFQEYLLQFGPQPGVTQMRFLGRPVEQLAAELGCSKLEAAQLQIRCDDNLLPYFASKMPVAVAHRFEGDVTINFFEGGGLINGGELVPDGADGDLFSGMDFAGEETAENRDFSDDAEGQSE